ncbi:hypothetical protein MMC21_002721 [Puttea exsequens]|nr:hypothetical protein [Puttea exsequens]
MHDKAKLSTKVPEDIAAKEFRPEEKGLYVYWANDGHESFFDWDWLQARRASPQFSISFWDASVRQNPPMIDYETIMKSDDGVKEWTSLIRKWGFCFVDGCPVSGDATRKLIERIAFIRSTHYDGDGGSSLLVDGFRAAEILRRESPAAYEALCRIKIRGHASGNEDYKFIPERSYPVLTKQEAEPGKENRVLQIRWNNDDRAALDAHDPCEVAAFYAAPRKWVGILRQPNSEYWEQLRPGRPLIFDNWRVLHGRSAFTGQREMCGGYTNMDDFISRWKTLNFSKEQLEVSV